MHVSPPQHQPCPRCQYPMLSGARICPNCGRVVAASPASSGRASLAAPNALPRASAPVAQSSLSSYMGSQHESVATITQPPAPAQNLNSEVATPGGHRPPAATPGKPPQKPPASKQPSNTPFSTISVIIILGLLSGIGLLLYLLTSHIPWRRQPQLPLPHCQH